MGKVTKLSLQVAIDGTAADNELVDMFQSGPLRGDGEGVVDLKGDKSSKGRSLLGGNSDYMWFLFTEIVESICGIVAEGMASGMCVEEFEVALDGTDDDHLTGDEIQGHTEEGRIAGLQAEEVTGDTGTIEHPLLFYVHRFGSPRGATGVDQYGGGGTAPLRKKFF